jgi:hypothetical protein
VEGKDEDGGACSYAGPANAVSFVGIDVSDGLE